MADTPSLTVPRLEVVMDDGRTLEVQALNPDLLRFDRTAAKHGWPKATEAPFLWLTFISWAALRRTDEIPEDMTWESFAEVHCLQVRNLAETNGEAPAAVMEVDPTPPDPGPA